MHLAELRIRGLRNITSAELVLAEGLNVFVGPNGAGKTSVLEAAYLLSRGGSFRTHAAEHLQQREGESLALFARIRSQSRLRQLGMLREAGRWVARLDGESSSKLAELFAASAVMCFEPGSHALVSGGAEGRRGFLDWGVFHVEHGHAERMRRFRRALRQRNVLLKQNGDEEQLTLWDRELSDAAEPVAQARETYLARFGQALSLVLEQHLPELGQAVLRHRPGWDRSISLQQALHDCRQRDRALGHTTRGPHRADWMIAFAHAPSPEQLSRGQEKLCAIACLLAQVRLFQESWGESPIIVFDDLCSELDVAHQASALGTLIESGAQILLSGTEIPDALRARFPPQRWFHVEQGQVCAMI